MITGSRSIASRLVVYDVLNSVPWRISALIHGGARGVDKLSGTWAEDRGIPVEVFNANWSAGRGAGVDRNRLMLTSAQAVVAIWDGESRGTAHALRISLSSGKPVYCYLLTLNRAGRVA